MVVPLNLINRNSSVGLTNPKKQRFLRFPCRKHKLSFLGVVETKMEVIDAFIVNKLWVGSYVDFNFVPSQGISGDLSLIWNSDCIFNVVIANGSRWISITFGWDNLQVRRILLYAPNIAADRNGFWEEILPLFCFNGAIFTLEDFNKIVHPVERKGCTTFSFSMGHFSKFINEASLLDIPLHSWRFT